MNPVRGPSLAVILLLTGCVSNKPPPPLPPATAEAGRLAAQASGLSRSGNWTAAAQAWERAARQYQLLHDQAAEAIALHNLAQASRQLERWTAAKNQFEQAIALNQRLNERSEWWRNQIALLQLEVETAQTNEVRQRMERLSSEADRLASPELRGLFFNEQGLWRQTQGELEAAGTAFNTATAAFKSAGNRTGEMIVLANLARLEEVRGRSGEALALWRSLLPAFQNLGDRRGIADALAGQARALYAARLDLPAAEAAARDAAENYGLLALPREREQTLTLLDKLLEERGRARRPAEQ